MWSASTNLHRAIPVLLGFDDAGRVEAWVAMRPGCVVFAGKESEALEKIPYAMQEYDRWLSRYGLSSVWAHFGRAASDVAPAPYVPFGEVRTGVCVVERVYVPEDVIGGNTAAFFGWDKQVPTDVEIASTLQVLSSSREELWATARALGAERWSERPGGGQRTVIDILRHVAHVEWWYMSRIVDFPVPEAGYPEEPEEMEAFLEWTRQRVVERLQALSSEELAAVTVPDTESGERWSARKVLRRLIYYELYHIRQLKKLLTP